MNRIVRRGEAIFHLSRILGASCARRTPQCRSSLIIRLIEASIQFNTRAPSRRHHLGAQTFDYITNETDTAGQCEYVLAVDGSLLASFPRFITSLLLWCL